MYSTLSETSHCFHSNVSWKWLFAGDDRKSTQNVFWTHTAAYRHSFLTLSLRSGVPVPITSLHCWHFVRHPRHRCQLSHSQPPSQCSWLIKLDALVTRLETLLSDVLRSLRNIIILSLPYWCDHNKRSFCWLHWAVNRSICIFKLTFVNSWSGAVQSLMWRSVTIINTSHHEREDSRWSTKRIFWHSSLIFSKIWEYWSKMDDGVERVNKSTDNHYHMVYFKLGWMEGMWWLGFYIWCYIALKEPQWDWLPANSKNSTQPGFQSH